MGLDGIEINGEDKAEVVIVEVADGLCEDKIDVLEQVGAIKVELDGDAKSVERERTVIVGVEETVHGMQSGEGDDTIIISGVDSLRHDMEVLVSVLSFLFEVSGKSAIKELISFSDTWNSTSILEVGSFLSEPIDSLSEKLDSEVSSKLTMSEVEVELFLSSFGEFLFGEVNKEFNSFFSISALQLLTSAFSLGNDFGKFFSKNETLWERDWSTDFIAVFSSFKKFTCKESSSTIGSC